MPIVSSISYAHIAAGSRADSEATTSPTPESKPVSSSVADSTPVAAEEPKETSISAEKSQSKDVSADPESKSEVSGKLAGAAVASTPAIDAAEESSSSAPATETEGDKKTNKKNQKKAQLNLAPAPVPTVSAWGKTVKAAPTKPLAVAKVDEDASKWPSPLSAIKDGAEATSASTSNNTKKPIAKTSGKEKWVPYEASVVISSSSSSGKPNKTHNKRTNRKKNIIPPTTNGASANNNGSKPGKTGSAAAKAPKRKVPETRKEDGSKSFEKDARSASTSAPNADASKTDAVEGESAGAASAAPSSANKVDSAVASAKSADSHQSNQAEKNGEEPYAEEGVNKAKKDEGEKNEAKLNGVDRQNAHREFHHNNHYNNNNYNSNSSSFHHTKNARYIRANYQPYKGKPHGNKHYFNNHSNNGNHHHNGEFKHGNNANNNGNGYVPFKQQQVPFVQGFIPQGGFKSHPPPPPFVPFYPPYGFYNGGDINGLPFPVPNSKLSGKNYNQQRYFNNAPGFVPGAGPIINPTNTDEQLKAIINQISYYFSTENLVKDIFLRKQMNSNGFIPIPVIANFFRVQNLSGGNYDLVLQAIQKIDFIEVKNEKARLQHDYQQWVLPATERSENGKDESESETTESSKPVDEVKRGVENLQVKE